MVSSTGCGGGGGIVVALALVTTATNANSTTKSSWLTLGIKILPISRTAISASACGVNMVRSKS